MQKLVMLFLMGIVLASAATAFVMIDRLGVQQTSPIHIRVSSTIDLEGNEDRDGTFSITASIPELGVRANKRFIPRSLQEIRKPVFLQLPDNINAIPPGTEVWVRYYVRGEDGEKRIRHRPLMIE